MDIVIGTLNELEKLGINGILVDVVVTKAPNAPWTLSYILYDNGKIGCDLANNETKVPYDSSFVGDLLHHNCYDIIREIRREKGNTFINSLITSITSALSHRLMNKDDLSTFGYYVEEYVDMSITPYNVFPIFGQTSMFIKSSDIVAMVGFHWILTTLCSKLAKKVLVTELIPPEELSVVDFKPEEPNVEILPAEKNREVLREADIVYITGETMVNNTIYELLEYSKNAKKRIIYGPTSSFYPEVLFKKGIDSLLAFVYPNSWDFKHRFVLSRGSWYWMKDVKQLFIGKEKEV